MIDLMDSICCLSGVEEIREVRVDHVAFSDGDYAAPSPAAPAGQSDFVSFSFK